MEIHHPEVVFTHLAIQAVALCVLLFFVVKWWIGHKTMPFFIRESTGKGKRNGWTWLLVACVLAAFVGLFVLISQAWLQVDDWWLVGIQTWQKRISGTGASLLFWNSRSGEFLIHLTGMSPERWEPRILNSLVVALAPLMLFRLCRTKKQRIDSWCGVLFYIFSFSLLMMNAHWKTYFHYANCANYVYPCVAALCLLGYYRPDAQDSPPSHLCCLWLFVLGCFCGGGAESLGITLSGILTVLFVLQKRGKIAPWSLQACAGYWGVLVGNVILYLAPALPMRTIMATSQIAFDAAVSGGDEVQQFLSNLSWQNMSAITGGGVIFIGRFSVVDRFLYFSSYLGERLLSCCWIGLAVFALLLVLHAVFGGRKSREVMLVSLAIAGVGLLMACMYLASCIPSPMSLFPPCMCLTVAVSVLFLNLESRMLRVAVSLVMLASCLVYLIPPGLEAAHYKKYELEQLARIEQQMADGKEDITLPVPFTQIPENRLELIAMPQFEASPQGQNSRWAAQYYKVKSLRQEAL